MPQDIISSLIEKLGLGGINTLIISIVLAVFIFIIGLVFGRIINSMMKKLVEQAEMEKMAKLSFIKLFLTVIEYSIYILFLNFSLEVLGIPWLTGWITSILIVIPALVGALLLIVAGFVIAVYLRGIIDESKIINHKILSTIVFYFITYVFSIFALRTALISLDRNTINIIVIILTALTFAGVVYHEVRKKK